MNFHVKTGIIYFKCVIYDSGNALKSAETIATLLNAYRPKKSVCFNGFVAVRYGKLEPCAIYISTDGKIQFIAQGLTDTNFGELYIDVVYPIA